MKATVDGAVMTSPPAGSALSTSATFQWTGGASPTNTYWLEVYRPSDGAVYFDAMVVSSAGTVSQLVTGLPNNSDVLAARLWTYMGSVSGGPPQWAFKDYRYRSAAKLVSCSAEDPGVVPDSAYAGATCSGCSWSSSLGRVSCSLTASPVTATGLARAASGFVNGDAYDLALWGNRTNGQDFCCLFHDPNNQVQAVWLTGSALADDLAFLAPETGHQLQPWGQAALHGRITGGSSADLIAGSHSAASGYTEELRGGSGNDTIRGNGGADTIYGEGDHDTLVGGDGSDLIVTSTGTDTVYAGTGNDTVVAVGAAIGTVLRGEAGSDVLCADMFRVQMHGSTAGSGGFNTMYWSSTASGGLGDQAEGILASSNGGSYAWCGHSSHAAKLGWCPSASLATVPTLCSQNGLAQ